MKALLAVLFLVAAAVADNQCPSDWREEELLRHDDCNKFYQCTFGVKVVRQCYGDLHFNLDTWQCDWQHLVDCTGRNVPAAVESEEESAPKPETVPEESAEAPGESEQTPEESEQIPEESEQASEESEQAPEESEQAPEESEPAPEESEQVPEESEQAPEDTQCPSDWTQEQLLPHDDCNKFYKCTYGVPVELQCYGDLYFNIDTWQCDWQYNVDCNGRNEPVAVESEEESAPESETVPEESAEAPEESEQAPEESEQAPEESEQAPEESEQLPEESEQAPEDTQCPSDWTQEQLLPHDDCNKFYKCTYGVPVELQCYGDLYFNIDTWQCDWQHNVDCNGRNDPAAVESEEESAPEPETVPEESEQAPEEPEQVPEESEQAPEESEQAPEDTQCPSDWTQEQLLPHDDCNKFYKCTYGVPVELQCYGDLYFNIDTWQCDWQHNVDCNGRNDPAAVESEEESAPKPETVPEESEQAPEEPEQVPEESEQASEESEQAPEESEQAPEESEPAPEESEQIPEESEQAPEDTQCPSDWTQEQLLRHDDCNKFYQCTFGVKVERQCYGDLHFNLDTWQCDWQHNVDCTGRNVPAAVESEEESAPEPETVSKESDEAPEESEQAPEESEQVPEESEQAPEESEQAPEESEQAPEESEQAPEESEQTPEESEQVAEESEQAPEDTQCPSDWTQEQLLPHDDCNKFYKCTYGVPVELQCYGNLYFNIDTWQCDWQHNVDCTGRNDPAAVESEEESAPEPETVPEESEQAPEEPEQVPEESEQASEESEQTPEESEQVPEESEQTPEDSEQASEESEQVPEESEQAPEESEQAPEEPCESDSNEQEPELVFQENGCPVNPHIHWLLPHEIDCNLFYYCVWGEKKLRNCPASLHFNRKLQVCDWPADAGCSVSANRFAGRSAVFNNH